MSFKAGKNYRVFITTENSTAAIMATGTPDAVTTTGLGPNGGASLLGIAKLGEVTGTSSTASEIKNVEAIEHKPKHIDAPVELFGNTRQLDNPIREDWEFTVTRKGEDKLFFRLFRYARFGVTGSDATADLYDGLSTMQNTTGYRLYLYDGTDFDVYYQGTIAPEGYVETLSPTGITSQQITFKGGKWKPGLESASMTAVESILQ